MVPKPAASTVRVPVLVLALAPAPTRPPSPLLDHHTIPTPFHFQAARQREVDRQAFTDKQDELAAARTIKYAEEEEQRKRAREREAATAVTMKQKEAEDKAQWERARRMYQDHQEQVRGGD